jgi:hypothetical protein
LLSHGAAPGAARCDLSTLSTPDGDKRNQTGGPMARKPVKFTDSLVEVIYICESCGTEIKRTIREK